MTKLKYCRRCGRIVYETSYTNNCDVCKEPLAGYVPDEYYRNKNTCESSAMMDNSRLEEFLDKYVRRTPEFSEKWYQIMLDKQKKAWERHCNPQTYATSSCVKCPYCNSWSTSKISATSRFFSFELFGFGSSKVGKQFHCRNCGANF